VPADLRDPDGAFATVRIPLMVIAVNAGHVGEGQRPGGFRDLTRPEFTGKVSMGDPLKSGTTFTSVAALSESYGWAYFEQLRANDIISAGGNSTVMSDIETGARPVGIILLENLLPSLVKGAPIAVVYPDDGAIPIPSPIAILASTDEPDLARRVYDFMFSDAMQAAIVAGHMYSPLPGRAPPEGARAWEQLKRYPWTNEFLASVSARRDEIKKRFRSIMR
jgi:iron(III) transport system substrate-binding protein